MSQALEYFQDKIQCRVLEIYLVHTHGEQSCWELAERTNDFRFDYNVCQDCIVHVLSKEDNSFSQKHLAKIFNDRCITH